MIVIARKWGLMCNQIFTMGHAIAASLECGTRVINPAFQDYASDFVHLKDDPLCRFPAKSPIPLADGCTARLMRTAGAKLSELIPRFHLSTRVARSITIGWHGECRLDDEQTRRYIDRTCLLFLDGWLFKAPAWFEKHGQAIREFFAPLPELEARAAAAAGRARENCDVLVGVHIRQGDYKEHLNGKYFYESEDYARIMRETSDLFPGRKVGFLVCSNRPQDPQRFAGMSWMTGDGHPVADLYSLAKCDYIFGPPSTFSQWASLYGNVPLWIVRGRWESPGIEKFEVFRAEMSHI
jgi:hypothetical protein